MTVPNTALAPSWSIVPMVVRLGLQHSRRLPRVDSAARRRPSAPSLTSSSCPTSHPPKHLQMQFSVFCCRCRVKRISFEFTNETAIKEARRRTSYGAILVFFHHLPRQVCVPDDLTHHLPKRSKILLSRFNRCIGNYNKYFFNIISFLSHGEAYKNKSPPLLTREGGGPRQHRKQHHQSSSTS